MTKIELIQYEIAEIKKLLFNLKYNAKKLNLDYINYDLPDICLHDCEIDYKSKKYFINVKTYNIAGKSNKNDISAVEKIYLQYQDNSNFFYIYQAMLHLSLDMEIEI